MELKISTHAYKRGKERIGLPKRSIPRQFELALTKGISQNDAKGRVKKYLDGVATHVDVPHHVCIWNNHVFIYSVQTTLEDRIATLITVLPLPANIARLVNYKERR